MIRKVRIEKSEIGLRFRHGEFLDVLKPGRYWAFGILGERIQVHSEKSVFLIHEDVDGLMRSGKLEAYAEAVDLKDDERFKFIPIVLCTSKGNESDKFWGQQQGANGHVVKPFKSEELLQAVKRALSS